MTGISISRRALPFGVLALSVSIALPAQARSATMQVGSDMLIARTMHLRALTVAQGGSLHADAGHALTLTVNGVQTQIAPGHYTGDVVLTVTDDIPVQFQQLPTLHFRTAIHVQDGRYQPASSVAAAVHGGSVTDTASTDVAISSLGENFNGILVGGSSTYTISNPRLSMTGNGGNDFAGLGAGIMSTDHADVTVNGGDITTHGVVRTAIFVGGSSTMHVNHTSIDVHNGVLPADYSFTIQVGKMKEVPWMLGLSGNVRATNLVDNGTVEYNDSHIRAQGWGALSTDDSKHVRMTANNSVIETVESGYGAYSIGDSLDLFRHCTFHVADVALIMAAQGSGTFTDGTVVQSRRYGVMMHSGDGRGTLTIDRKSVFTTAATGIEVKGRGATVVIDDAQIHAGNGVLLQAMVNDDPFAAGAGPIVGVQGSGAPAAPPGMPPAPPGGMPPPVHPDVDVTVANTQLAGDIVNSRTKQGGLNLVLRHASLAGRVSTAVQAPVDGQAPTHDTYRQIGAVTNSFAASRDRNGLSVSLDGASAWTVAATSYLTELKLAPGAQVAAAPGHRLTLTVDGTARPLAPGDYHGGVVLAVD